MPFKDPIQRKNYHKNYYETKQKNKPKKEQTPPPTTDDDEYSDTEYEIEDVPSPPQKIVKPQSYNVDTEYTNYLYNKEYIPYPQHIQPFIQNNLRNIQPTRPMVSQHNQNLPNKYIFL